jgi:hypothetical protein
MVPGSAREYRTLRELTVQRLRPEHITQAFPLIQAALPGVPLEAWVDFARALIEEETDRPETGILCIVSEQGYIAGLSSYRVEHSLMHGQTLTADHFVALDMFGRRAVVHALAEAVEALARTRNCGAIHTTLIEKGALIEKDGIRGVGHTISALTDRGHEVEAVRLCKILPHGDNLQMELKAASSRPTR